MKTFVLFAVLLITCEFAFCSEKVVIETPLGNIVVTLDSDKAPKNVTFFLKHMEERVFQGSSFRSGDGTCIMGGAPGKSAHGYSSSGNMSWKVGAPGEFALKNRRGALVMGRTVGGCNPYKTSNSTQFALDFLDDPQDDGEFTVIGYVSEGMEVVEKIASELKSKKTTIPISDVHLLSAK